MQAWDLSVPGRRSTLDPKSVSQLHSNELLTPAPVELMLHCWQQWCATSFFLRYQYTHTRLSRNLGHS
eukprot:10827-Heterococcus_DN1.PRE.3